MQKDYIFPDFNEKVLNKINNFNRLKNTGLWKAELDMGREESTGVEVKLKAECFCMLHTCPNESNGIFPLSKGIAWEMGV